MTEEDVTKILNGCDTAHLIFRNFAKEFISVNQRFVQIMASMTKP